MRRLLAALLLVLAFGGVADAAVVFDATGNGTEVNNFGGSGSPFTFSITLGAGTKAVQVHIGSVNTASTANDFPTITAVTVGTTSLSYVTGSRVASGSGLAQAETWGGQTTLAGAQTVTVTFNPPGSNYTIVADAMSVTGADTTTPITNGAGSSNSASPLSLNMTSAAGDLTSTMFVGGGGTGVPTTNQTTRWSTVVINPQGGDRGPGTLNPTHTWTGTGIDWTLGGVLTGANFLAAGTGDTTPPTTPGTPTINSVTSVSVTVDWTASTDNVGVTAYDLQRAVGTNSFTQIATPTTNSTYTDLGVSPGTMYTWRVRARDAAGNTSAFATSASTNTLNSVSRTLSWNATAPLTQDGFSIFRCVTSGASCPPSTTTTYATTGPNTTTYLDTGGALPTSCYQVQATLAGTAGSGLSNIACASGTLIRLTISSAGTGSGSTNPAIGTTNFTNGTVVGLTATPNPASDFAAWSGDADCSDGSVTLNTSTACTATFNAQKGNFAYLGNRGFLATRALTNTVTVTAATTSQKNNMVVVRAVTDNISTTSGQTGDHQKVTDSLGNQYVKLGEQTRSGGSAGTGVTVSLWASRLFSSLTSPNTVTLTLSTATIANALTLEEYELNASTTFTNASTTGTNGASASPSAVISALSSAFRVFIGLLGVESAGTASATSSNTYVDGTFAQSPGYASGTTTNATVGSATSANVVSIFGFLRASASTGNTYSPTLAVGTSPNWALLFSGLSTAVSVNSHPLTLATTGAGNGTVTGAGTYYQGSVVQIQAIPNSTSAFAGWFTTAGSNCTDPTNPTVNVTVNLDTICTASFSVPNVVLPNRVLTIATAGTGGGTTMGAGTYPDGTVVSITAQPNASSFFAGWTPAACSTGSVTMTADITCTATFTLLPNVALAITTTGTGLGSVTGAGTYVQGSNATLTATPNVGSVFAGWSGSTGCTGTTSPLTLLMDAAKTCTATFTLFTGQGPTGSILTQSYKRCTASFVLAFTSTLTISNVVWSVDGVQTMSQNPGGKMTQTTAPFIFQKSLVKDGALITAVATDVAGQAATMGPTVLACP